MAAGSKSILIVAVLAAALAAIAGRAQIVEPALSPDEQGELAKARDYALRIEQDQEARLWSPGLLSSCDGRDDPARPLVCVRLLDRGPLRKSGAARIALRWRNLPHNGVIIVDLVRGLPPAERIALVGPIGRLETGSVPASGDGQAVIQWRVESIPCGGDMVVPPCPIEVGRYRLRASAYDVTIIPRRRGERAQPVAQGRSERFDISGTPDWAPLEEAMRWRAGLHMQYRHGLRTRTPVVRAGPVQRRGGRYCMRAAPTPPFEGELLICGPGDLLSDAGLRVLREELAVSGRVRLRPGAMAPAEAERRAFETAARPYLDRVRFRDQPSPREAGAPAGGIDDFHSWSRANPNATTYLSDNLVDLAYRDEGGYWLFVISEIMAGGDEGAIGRFADKILVRVGNDGVACIVETVPYRGMRFRHDIRQGRVDCPRQRS